jgi:hypothetical protein
MSNVLKVALLPGVATLVQGDATATTNTIGTPPAFSKLKKLLLSLTESAIAAADGEITVTVALNGATVFVDKVYVTTTAGTAMGVAYSKSIDFDTLAFSTGSAGTLTVDLSAALTGGSLVVNSYFV